MSGQVAKLPVFASAFESIALVGRNIGFLLRRGVVWMLLTVFAKVVYDHWMRKIGWSPTEGFTVQDLVYATGNSAIAITMLARFAVRWHRRILGPSAEQRTGVFTAAVAYGSLALALNTAVNFLLYLPPIYLSDDWRMLLVFALAWFLASALVATRLGLMLPAIAIGADSSVRAAWTASRGNAWRMFFGGLITIFAPFVVLIGSVWLIGKAIASQPNSPSVANQPMDPISIALVSIIASVLGISYLSVAYRHLVMNRKEAAA